MHLHECHGGVETILETERAISSEIVAFREMGVFPATEIAAVRREVKAFRDLSLAEDRSGEGRAGKDPFSVVYPGGSYGADLEAKLCEKKLAILRVRRQEEQVARATVIRRQMKVKAVEESEAKDPANFRNQKKF